MSKTYRVNPNTHEEQVEKVSKGLQKTYSKIKEQRRRRERVQRKRDGWDG